MTTRTEPAKRQTVMPKVGVEPTRVSPHEFESCASAYSATSAQSSCQYTVCTVYRQMCGQTQSAKLDSPTLPQTLQDDNEAIERALNGDLEAFNQLVLEYQRLAYSVAYRMLQDQDSASDAVQESFIKAYRALDTFRGGSFKSWLMRIVANSCYDILRARQRRATDSIDDESSEQEYAPHLVDGAESPQSYAERMELSEYIESCIGSLPSDQRLAITLCDVHGYAYEEISEITGVPMGTVKSRISRARRRLRDYLLEYPELLPSSLRPKHE